MATQHLDITRAQIDEAIRRVALAQAGVDPNAPGLSISLRYTDLNDRRESVTNIGGVAVIIVASES